MAILGSGIYNIGVSGRPYCTEYIPKNSITNECDLLWSAGTKVTTGTGTIDKSPNPPGWDAGAVARIPIEGDFMLEWKFDFSGGDVMFGLSYLYSGKTSYHYSSIDFAVEKSPGNFAYIWQLGVLGLDMGSTVASDVFSLKRVGTDMIWQINGVDKYTENGVATGAMFIDNSFEWYPTPVIDIKVTPL